MLNAERLFVITIICFISIFHCRTSTIGRLLMSNQNSFNEICFDERYSNKELNANYPTANSYIEANYKNYDNELRYSREFYQKLIIESKLGELSQFIKGSTISYIFLLVVAFAIIISIY